MTSKNTNKNGKAVSQNITLKYLIGGLICLIINLVLDLGIIEYTKDIPVLYWVCVIVSKAMSTVGLALIIGCITNKIKYSSDEYSFMDEDQKKKVLETIVSNDGKLDDYRKQLITQCLDMEERFKTNVSYHVKIFNGDDGKVHANTIMICKEFREEDFDNIVIGFDQPTSYVEKVKVYDPDDPNHPKIIDRQSIKATSRTANGSDLEYSKLCKLPEQFKKRDCLSFEKEFVLCGQDHWISYALLFQCPMQGVHFVLETQDGLIIQEVTIFGENDTYSKTQTPTTLTLDSSKWLSHNNGFIIIVSNTSQPKD